jgi:hypothetical protein
MKNSIFIFILIAIISCSPKSSSNIKELDYGSFTFSLDSIMELDQKIRKQISEAMQSNTPLPSSIFQKMEEVDSSNQAWLKMKLDIYGWPEKSKIGEKAARAVFLVIQHTDLPDIEKYYPQLHSLAESGEASKVHAAMMLDRMLMYQGKKQVYGTQASSLLRSDGSFVIWPVENPERINEKRKTVGFPDTVEETAASMDAVYNPYEQLPSIN